MFQENDEDVRLTGVSDIEENEIEDLMADENENNNEQRMNATMMKSRTTIMMMMK